MFDLQRAGRAVGRTKRGRERESEKNLQRGFEG